MQGGSITPPCHLTDSHSSNERPPKLAFLTRLVTSANGISGRKAAVPGDQGFDTVIHAGSAGATGDYFFPFSTEKGLPVINPVDGNDGDYLTDRLTDDAVDYVQANKDSLFLLVMAHYAVHTPIQAPENVTKKHQHKLRKAGIVVGSKRDDADFVADRQGRTKTVQDNPTYAAVVEKQTNHSAASWMHWKMRILMTRR